MDLCEPLNYCLCEMESARQGIAAVKDASPSLYLEAHPPSPHQGDVRLSDPPSDQGASGVARTRNTGDPADLLAGLANH
ncbi:hypothetical protein PoB_001149800 [Plakobranchus ocellatus]|uniref:Uncharacterized protein n=1 Tax=Plakobranchus ocellatus TaxID=259542 RepID=A0AAV3YR06_9GAST|nr:hypothetical protein PoB_001149800 [Plakobranchus ocellatus]